MNSFLLLAALAGAAGMTPGAQVDATSVHIPNRPPVARASFRLTGAKPKTLTKTAASQSSTMGTRGALSSDRKTLTFRQKTVRLVVTSGPENDMLSYRIAGLRNPTLVVPMGTTLNALFINTDGDMAHNLRFSAQRGPFQKGSQDAMAVGTTDLPHRTETAFHAEDVTAHVSLQAGTYTYLCTVPGHAQGGMYGTLIVR